MMDESSVQRSSSSDPHPSQSHGSERVALLSLVQPLEGEKQGGSSEQAARTARGKNEAVVDAVSQQRGRLTEPPGLLQQEGPRILPPRDGLPCGDHRLH